MQCSDACYHTRALNVSLGGSDPHWHQPALALWLKPSSPVDKWVMVLKVEAEVALVHLG